MKPKTGSLIRSQQKCQLSSTKKKERRFYLTEEINNLIRSVSNKETELVSKHVPETKVKSRWLHW